MNSPVPNRNQRITPSSSTQTPRVEVDLEHDDEQIVEIDLSAIPAGGPLKKSSRDKHKKQMKNWNWKQDHFSSLEDALLCPDLYGPIRIPRYGSSDRTVLCLEKTVTQIVGSATVGVKGILSRTAYAGTIADAFQAVDENTLITTTGGITPGILYPPAASLTDVSIVGMSMTVQYIGKPLDAQGTVLLACVPDTNGSAQITATSYTGLTYLPNTVVVPTSSLLDEPLRVSLLHMSPGSWEFYSTSTNIPDTLIPIIACSGLAANTNLRIEITATFEGRTSISSPNAIPYEAATASKASDLSLMENVTAQLGDMYNQVSEYIPSAFSRSAMGALREAGEGFIAKGATGLMHAASGRILNHVLHGGGQEFRRALRST